MDLSETRVCLEQLRYVEMSYICTNAALDAFLFILKQPRAQIALSPIISGVEGVHLDWTHVNIVDGQGKSFAQPIHKETVLALQNHLYVSAHFASMRDVSMVVMKFLRHILTEYYVKDSVVDHSWFHSWRDFVVYANVDIESVPEAPEIDSLFSLTEFLSGREAGERKEEFGQQQFFSALTAARGFVSSVSEMVAHDLSRKRPFT